MASKRIQLRRDLKASFTLANPILKQGEPAYEIDTKLMKIGDGETAYNSLPYKASISAGGGVTTSTVADNYVSSTSYVLTPNSGVQVAIATITFTASAGYYYIKQPVFSLASPYKSAFSITSTTTKDSIGRITAKVFVIKYTNTVSSSGDIILFDHETAVLPITKNIYNNNLIELTSFNIDTSDMPSIAVGRSFVIKGSPNARFNLKVTRSSDSKTYDFTTGTFTTAATQITDQIINSTGDYTDSLVFPTVTAEKSSYFLI